MSPLSLYLLNVLMLAVFPIYTAMQNTRRRTISLYIYVCILLLLGGVLGSVYSLQLPGGIIISGGNITYGAFMMSAVMLIIMEHHISTFRNLVRIIILVDLLNFCLFNFLYWILSTGQAMNPLNAPAEIFRTSLWVLVTGGFLLLLEMLILLAGHLQIRRFVKNLQLLAVTYTVLFVAVICLDGVLFPLLVLGDAPDILSIMIGNVTGKFVLAASFAIPLLFFYLALKNNLLEFLNTPLEVKDFIIAPRERLLDELYNYRLIEEQLEDDNRKLTLLSRTDALTGLSNRAHFDAVLESEWSRAARDKQTMTLVIGDIDYFKQYNDTYGHQQGDTCLRDVAEIWGSTFNRTSDVAARIGGEEFAIILPNTTAEECLPNVQDIQKRLSLKALPHSASDVANLVTMSIGIAQMSPGRDTTPDMLYRAADAKLYEAKRTGRNKIAIE